MKALPKVLVVVKLATMLIPHEAAIATISQLFCSCANALELVTMRDLARFEKPSLHCAPPRSGLRDENR
jgi:hypothetical protein